jgi:hypothetical protein
MGLHHGCYCTQKEVRGLSATSAHRPGDVVSALMPLPECFDAGGGHRWVVDTTVSYLSPSKSAPGTHFAGSPGIRRGTPMYTPRQPRHAQARPGTRPCTGTCTPMRTQARTGRPTRGLSAPQWSHTSAKRCRAADLVRINLKIQLRNLARPCLGGAMSTHGAS